MNIPIEIVVVFMAGIVAMQGWILREIVSLKVKMARTEELEKRIKRLESQAFP